MLCHLIVALVLLGKGHGNIRKTVGASVYISVADTHTWAQGQYVLSAVYVDSDAAALFSFQYTTGFEILRLSFCSRLFLLFSLLGFSCAAPCGFQEISLWKYFPRSHLAVSQRGL